MKTLKLILTIITLLPAISSCRLAVDFHNRTYTHQSNQIEITAAADTAVTDMFSRPWEGSLKISGAFSDENTELNNVTQFHYEPGFNSTAIQSASSLQFESRYHLTINEDMIHLWIFPPSRESGYYNGSAEVTWGKTALTIHSSELFSEDKSKSLFLTGSLNARRVPLNSGETILLGYTNKKEIVTPFSPLVQVHLHTSTAKALYLTEVKSETRLFAAENLNDTTADITLTSSDETLLMLYSGAGFYTREKIPLTGKELSNTASQALLMDFCRLYEVNMADISEAVLIKRFR